MAVPTGDNITLRTPRSVAVPAVDARLAASSADIRFALTLSADVITQRAHRLGCITVARITSHRIRRAQVVEARLTRVTL